MFPIIIIITNNPYELRLSGGEKITPIKPIMPQNKQKLPQAQKGEGKPESGLHSHHDLAEIVAELVQQNRKLERIAECQTENVRCWEKDFNKLRTQFDDIEQQNRELVALSTT